MNDRVCAIVDIDGTVVDTNYHHTVAWGRAFAEHGIRVPLWHLHRHNGMGGEQLVASVAGQDAERRLGDAVRASESRHDGELIGEVVAGWSAPLTCSASFTDSAWRLFLRRAPSGRRSADTSSSWTLATTWTRHLRRGRRPDEAEPDLIVVAMRKANAAERFVMIGDTTWDAIATVRAGVPAIGLLSGGFGEDELRAAGCEAVFAGADELTAHLDRALGILIGVTSGTAGT